MTDREKLIDLLCHIPGAEEIADFFLANGVTFANDNNDGHKLDAVRCGSCRFAIDETADGWMWCNNWNSGTTCDGYCHAGERKD